MNATETMIGIMTTATVQDMRTEARTITGNERGEETGTTGETEEETMIVSATGLTMTVAPDMRVLIGGPTEGGNVRTGPLVDDRTMMQWWWMGLHGIKAGTILVGENVAREAEAKIAVKMAWAHLSVEVPLPQMQSHWL
jgi:hypothetical protein